MAIFVNLDRGVVLPWDFLCFQILWPVLFSLHHYLFTDPLGYGVSFYSHWEAFFILISGCPGKGKSLRISLVLAAFSPFFDILSHQGTILYCAFSLACDCAMHRVPWDLVVEFGVFGAFICWICWSLISGIVHVYLKIALIIPHGHQSFCPNPLLWSLLMPSNSPTSPLSLSNSFDGSVDHQDIVSPPPHTSQPGIPSVLDGGRSDNHGQSARTQLPTYSATLKRGVGGHSNPQMPSAESKLCAPLRESSSPGNLPLNSAPIADAPGNSSSTPLTHSFAIPTISTDELLACCLLGSIWGEPLPLPTIIHRTRNDWKFVKGHIEYI